MENSGFLAITFESQTLDGHQLDEPTYMCFSNYYVHVPELTTMQRKDLRWL